MFTAKNAKKQNFVTNISNLFYISDNGNKYHDYLNGALYIVYSESRPPLSLLCDQVMIFIPVTGAEVLTSDTLANLTMKTE